ncbi:MAG: helix-turn-helix domain-containing protein [Oscillospiraceae bacterium]|jgi:transcriptional regulator with XRE-family HTH domain|nr:helix-turn-helix domain-containing protein [Oscillospiraceae bacterium]
MPLNNNITRNTPHVNGMGRVLRGLRIALDLSAKDLAAKMGVSPTFISDVEAGRKKPSLELIDKYSKALDISRAKLMYFDEEAEKQNYNHQKILLTILEKICEL